MAADGSATRVESAFDWCAPDYRPVLQARVDRLRWMSAVPGRVQALRAYYRDHPADFIDDWGCTMDPRNVARGVPAFSPFLLMPKQREMIEWIRAR